MSKHDQKNVSIIYCSHGGGPLPLLGDASHQAMVECMRGLPAGLGQPKAILVISAHWEEEVATVLAGATPPLFFDYYGFPDAAYAIEYPVQGHPDLANRVADALQQAGIAAHLDQERGFDHGVFIPLLLMYPQAEIPTIQLSLVRGLDPAAHVELGKALRPLMGEGMLVIGSGFSFHNMRAFSRQAVAPPDAANDAFQNWLIERVCNQALSASEREAQLCAWETAPSARYCHPRSEHLLPLHVCIGLAQRPGQVLFDAPILGKRAVAFGW